LINNSLPRSAEIHGAKITSLVDELQQAGVYNVKFEGSQLSSGFYYYRLEAGDINLVKKMLVLK